MPAATACGLPRSESSLAEQVKLDAMNGAAVITEQGMHGITFLRGGVPTECDQFDFDCMHTDAYARDWNNTMLWLDAAAAVGVKVLMNDFVMWIPGLEGVLKNIVAFIVQTIVKVVVDFTGER